jgi:hypothetical protein
MQALISLERVTEPNKTTEKSGGPPPKYSYNAPIIPLYRDVGRLSKKRGDMHTSDRLFPFKGVRFLPALYSVQYYKSSNLN